MKEDTTQDKMIPGGKFDKEKKYWQEKLSGGLKPGGFPVDYAENGFDGNKRQKLRFRFPGEILTKLLSISNNSQYGIFIILATGVNYLLFKYTRDEDIIIGVPVLKQKTYGAGSNKMMVLRNPVKPMMTFKDLLLQVKHTAAEANEHSDYYPFNEIIKLVNLSPRDGSSAHLSVMMGFKNIHGKGLFNNQKADTFFSFEMTEEYLECEINYNSMLFSDKTIECLGRQLINYFAAITQNPVSKLSGIDIVSREEKQQILYQFNNTPANYPRSKTISRLFAEQVEKTPGRTAVVYEDNRLIYEELDRQSNRLARMLKQEYGVGEGDIVAFQVPRSPEMIIGIMGILKANASCLPVDPRYPGERIVFLLKDSEAKFVLKEIDSEKLKKFSPAALENTGKPGSVAYIIYTSGSTGRPKGVMLHHRGIINHVYTKINELDVNGGDILCQNLNIGFVASIWQFFAPLFVGAKLHIYPENVLVDPYRFFERIARDQTSVAEVVPSLLNAYLELLEAGKVKIHLHSLKVLALTGEKVTPSLVNKFHKKYRINLVNAYGQSECSDDTLHYKIPYNIGTKAVPIGKPANNTRVYVLSPDRRLQPPGVPGELHISGDGLAIGYLNNPDLTAEAFVPNPFEPGERMYRTGDLCRWLPDGNIEFSGRIDHQVKISGFRVELQEIENRLLTRDEIKEAVVTARGGEGNKYLCAYIVAHSTGSSARSPIANTSIFALSPSELQLELREYLSAGLPDYMIPSHFIPVEKIPLTPSGKIDRQALPEPEKKTVNAGDGVSGDEIEEKLAGLWSGILKMDAPKIDRNANFFELGGNSLRAVALVSKIHKELNVDISLTEIFDFPTIKGLAQFVKEAAKETYASIEAVEKKEYYPSSSAQKRLYVMQQMDKKITAYNVVQAVILQGIFEKEKLEEIFVALIRRHESLRTSFETIGDEPVQRIHDEVEFEIEQHTPAYSHPSQEGIVKAFVRPFDLANAPLLRVGLIERGNREYILMVDIHHIISDGTSHRILIQEFETLDSGERLKALRLQYKDFSEWQNRLVASGKINIQEEYWLRKFEGEIPVLNLPTDYPRPGFQSFDGNTVAFEIDSEATKAIDALVSGEKVTLYIVLLSMFNILMAKISGQEDIVIGTAAAGRKHADLEGIIGMFVNTLALRNKPEGKKTFRKFLDEVKEKTLAAFENQEYQFEDLVGKVSVRRDTGRNPLFDVMFVLQNVDTPEVDVPGLKVMPYEYRDNRSKFDITLAGLETEDSLFFSFNYCTKLYRKSTIERFINYFKKIVTTVVEDPGKKIAEIEIITEEEKRQVLYDFNRTAASYPQNKTIHELFEDQAEKTPDSAAVVSLEQDVGAQHAVPFPKGHIFVTYKELNDRSKRLAHVLQGKGVEPTAIVGIMVEQSIEFIVGILGILKTGGAYLPIDPQYPQERIDFMLKDSNARVLLAAPTAKVKDKKEFIEFIDIFKRLPSSTSTLTSTLGKVSSANLAYIIYTSGTTGTPRGVMVGHRSLINLCYWHIRYYEVNEFDHAGKYAGIGFDASVWEIFPYIIKGASLYIIDESIKLDIEKLNRFYERHDITIGFLPTQLCEQFMELENRSLRKLLTGGDKLRVFKKKNYDLYNNYGPTENTVVCTSCLVERYDDNIPIGKPIANNRIYIFDRNYLHLQPIGVVGGLCIGGDSLARGYLHDEALTAEKFIDNPVVEGERIYKTGDLARWLPDGNIEFWGRVDHQVKVRGYRIELGEIESRLLSHNEVKEAVVVLGESKEPGEGYLCAYFVSDHDLSIEGLREYLAVSLPDYMIPLYYVQMEKIPVTPNGKVDRKALPEPGYTGKREYAPPRDELEVRLVKIWSGVLDRDASHASQLQEIIGIDDNFFELGGHSLKATMLVSRIHKEFNVKVPLSEIFNMPTIRGLSKYIRAAEVRKYVSLEPVEKKEYYPLSSAQSRLYILRQMDENHTGYNMPQTVTLEGEIERNKLEGTFKKLIRRHESLRTSFEMLEEEPVQKIHDNVEFSIRYHDLATISNFVRPFNLSEAPLLRVGLIRTGNWEHSLLLDMHHIITDGISQQILTNEFMALYKGEQLSPLRLHYKDYALWQNREKEKERVKKQEKYWIREFAGEIPVLNLPVDFPRPALQSFEGNTLGFTLGEEETRRLKNLVVKENVTLYMVLLALFDVFLFKITGSEDIVVGTPAAGRRHADLQQIIGMFVNTLALRNNPAGQKNFTGFLKEVKQKALAAFENQEYPFEDLVEEVAVTRDTSRNPIFDLMFALQNIETKNEAEETPGREIPGLNTAKFDLTLTGMERGECLFFTFDYCTRLFTRETVARFTGYFQGVVSAVIEDPGRKISTIEIISPEEKNWLLYEFNDTGVDLPAGKTVHEWIQEQTEKSPDSTGIIESDSVGILTYKELNKEANRLARTLRAKGVNADDTVALMADPSLEMIIGIFAILKAGGAYLPVDPAYPRERIRYLLEDSETCLLLTRGKYSGSDASSWETINLEDKRQYQEDGSNLAPVSGPDNLVYVIYTSGSTGKPKGVTLKINGFVNLLRWYTEEFNMDSYDRVLLIASISFDLAQKNLFAPFLKGGCLCLPSGGLQDYHSVSEFIAKEKISIVNCAPSAFYPLVELNSAAGFDKIASLRYVFLGGEPIQGVKLMRWLNSANCRCEIVNTYGPTECTDIASFYRLTAEDIEGKRNIPIGKPIYNVKLYILDKNSRLLPVGLSGELCIGGIGLAKGYHNNPGLTGEKFFQPSGLPGITVYRTGDRVRMLPGGNIEFLGRIDFQVKIRGFRIELGEIENRLLEHDEIKEAVAAVKEDAKGANYLCAYVVSDKTLSEAALQEYLSGELPDYMIPAYFVQLEKIPVTPSGKVDRKALPEPEAAAGEYTAPRNEMEERLVEIWTEVLGLHMPPGIDADFFRLGGHSLKATILASRIHKDLNVKVPLVEIFRTPTIRELSKYIKRLSENKYAFIEKVPKKEYYGLSSIQKRFYIQQQKDLDSINDNMPRVMALGADIKKEKLQESFKELINRHESLRTSFLIVKGEPVQKVHESVEFSIKYHDYPNARVEVESEFDEMIKDFIRPFDLSRAPLLRVHLIKSKENRHFLVVDIHHIISDGISQDILERDFIALYEGKELPPLRIQYKDFARWENKRLESGEIEKQEKYWLNRFKGNIPVLDIPTDYLRPPVRDSRGDTILLEIGNDLTKKIKKMAAETQTNLNIIFQAIYNILLSKYSRQEDIVIGTPVSGRTHVDLENIIGVFLNMVAIRNFPGGNKTFAEFLEEVKENIHRAYENQEYQFDRLVAELGLQGNRSRNPLFEVVFVYQNMIEENTGDGGHETEGMGKLTVTSSGYDTGIAKFDLIIAVLEHRDSIKISLTYSSLLFKKSTAEKMSKRYIEILDQAVENREIKLKDLAISHDLLAASKDTPEINFGF